MWHPQSWEEVKALEGHAEETQVLDFKRDLAALALGGGVLVYGADEDKEGAVVHEIIPFPLKQVEERLQQIAGSAIAPPLDIEVQLLRAQPGDTQGVAIVIVPPSPMAPHQVSSRFPVRRGTTTEYLSEQEIERLYRQRAAFLSPHGSGPALDRFVPLLPATQTGGLGYVDLLVEPVARDLVHPAGAWQQDPLLQAVRHAVARHRDRLKGISMIQCFNALSEWSPWSVAGWRAGGFTESQSFHVASAEFGAVMAYPARMSFQGRWGLVVGEGGRQLYRSARELQVAAELTGMLAIAGEYFATVPAATMLVVALRMTGFENALAEAATRNRPDVRPGGPSAPHGLTNETQWPARTVREKPDVVAEQLIERWLPAFSAGTHVLGPLRNLDAS